jgi:molybdopterin-guanine dinucleotide biosynthesis protein A
VFPVSSPLAIGAILAGGASRRFGSPKALVKVGGRAVIERVRDAVRDAGLEPRLITSRPEWFTELDLPSRPDAVPGAGPLGGIHAALSWALEEGQRGTLCVPCDTPFLPPGLLRALAAGAGNDMVVVPESGGPREIEPLCAYYPVSCLPQIENHLARGRYRLIDLLDAIPIQRIPVTEVRRWGEPEHIFLNLNTPEDHRRAEELARV